MHADWDGAAYTAYATAASDVAHALTEDGTKLADQSKRLSMAGQLLRWARSGVDSVLSQFDQYGAQLVNQARSADPNAVGAFIAAARDLGEQAVAAAGQVADELSDALAELFPAPWAGPMSKPGKLGKRIYGPLSWVNGDTLDGRKRPRSVPSWFGNSGWKKLTWNGLEGTRAPKKADTPFGQPKQKSAIARATEITYLKTAHEQDGFIPEYDGKISSQGWDAKASGHAELGFREDIGTSGSYGVAHGGARFGVRGRRGQRFGAIRRARAWRARQRFRRRQAGGPGRGGRRRGRRRRERECPIWNRRAARRAVRL